MSCPNCVPKPSSQPMGSGGPSVVAPMVENSCVPSLASRQSAQSSLAGSGPSQANTAARAHAESQSDSQQDGCVAHTASQHSTSSQPGVECATKHPPAPAPHGEPHSCVHVTTSW